MNKFGIALLVVLVVALFSRSSVSKNNETETVVLSESNLLVLNNEVNGDSVGPLISKARSMDVGLAGRFGNNKKPMYLFLSTPGGSIQAGLELIEALNGIGRPVHTVTLFAASMGWQIAQNLGDRLVLKNGIFMAHHAAGEFSGSFGGMPTQLDARLKLWTDRIKELDMQTVKRTKGKQTYESYIKAYDHELWDTGAKAVEEGYADKVVMIKCDSSLNGVSTHHTSFMGLDLLYDLDSCPLNTSPMNVRVGGDLKNMSQGQVEEVKKHFLEQYEFKARQVVPMY